jgi:hypothetical protein
LYFFTKFRRSREFFANFYEKSRVVGFSTVSDISAALGVAVVAWLIAVACATANECVPDVASIPAAAGEPLVPDVLTVDCFPAFIGVPGVVGFPAVAFIPAFADVSAVAVVPAVHSGFAVASFPANPVGLSTSHYELPPVNLYNGMVYLKENTVETIKKAYASCIRYTRNSREDNNSMAPAIAGTPTAGTTKAGTTKAGTPTTEGTPGTLETPVGEKTAVRTYQQQDRQ